MRELKFRAWEKINKEMVYNPPADCTMDCPINVVLKPSIYYDWMQYTGRKDKNGKEIYEGDIVRRTGNDLYGKKFSEMAEVLWENNTSSFCAFVKSDVLNYGIIAGEDYEVMGNIYETPELLNQKP